MKNKIILFDIDYTLFNTDSFKLSGLKEYSLYEEIEAVLHELSKIAELGIFSKGESEFQKTKLEKTGIEKLFNENNVHVFEDKVENLKEVLAKYNNQRIYLIDDKLNVLFNGKTNNPAVFTIWIERGPFAKDKSLLNVFSPDATVSNLEEIISIISKD